MYSGQTYNEMVVIPLENLFVIILSCIHISCCSSICILRNAWGSVVVCLFVCCFEVLNCLLIGCDWLYNGWVCCGNSSVVCTVSSYTLNSNMASGGQDRKPGWTNYPSRDARREYGGPGLSPSPEASPRSGPSPPGKSQR